MNQENKRQKFNSCNKPYASFYGDLESDEISFAGLGVDQYKFVRSYNRNDSSTVVDKAIRRGNTTDEKLIIAKKCALIEGTKKTNTVIRLRAVVDELGEVKTELAEKNTKFGKVEGDMSKMKAENENLKRKLAHSEGKNVNLNKKVKNFIDVSARLRELESNKSIVSLSKQLETWKATSKDFNACTGILHAGLTDLNMILQHKNLGKVEVTKNNSKEPVKWIFNGNTHFLSGNRDKCLLEAADEQALEDGMSDVEPEDSLRQYQTRTEPIISQIP